jgi:hypothetical protein
MESQINDINNKMIQKNEETERFRREHERYRHKVILYEE